MDKQQLLEKIDKMRRGLSNDAIQGPTRAALENSLQNAEAQLAQLEADELPKELPMPETVEEAIKVIEAPKSNATGLGCNVTRNLRKNGVEIRFKNPVSAEVSAKLKAKGFNYSRFQNIWYNRYSESVHQWAIDLCGDTEHGDNPAAVVLQGPADNANVRLITLASLTSRGKVPQGLLKDEIRAGKLEVAQYKTFNGMTDSTDYFPEKDLKWKTATMNDPGFDMDELRKNSANRHWTDSITLQDNGSIEYGNLRFRYKTSVEGHDYNPGEERKKIKAIEVAEKQDLKKKAAQVLDLSPEKYHIPFNRPGKKGTFEITNEERINPHDYVGSDFFPATMEYDGYKVTGLLGTKNVVTSTSWMLGSNVKTENREDVWDFKPDDMALSPYAVSLSRFRKKKPGDVSDFPGWKMQSSVRDVWDDMKRRVQDANYEAAKMNEKGKKDRGKKIHEGKMKESLTRLNLFKKIWVAYEETNPAALRKVTGEGPAEQAYRMLLWKKDLSLAQPGETELQAARQAAEAELRGEAVQVASQPTGKQDDRQVAPKMVPVQPQPKPFLSDYPLVQKFMPRHQQLVVREAGAERDAILADVEAMLAKIPGPYSQEKKGNKATVLAHYFYGQSDWFITEFHPDNEGDEEFDRFYGFFILNGDSQMAESGYVSVQELTKNRKVELDFHWRPVSLEVAKFNADPDYFPEPESETNAAAKADEKGVTIVSLRLVEGRLLPSADTYAYGEVTDKDILAGDSSENITRNSTLNDCIIVIKGQYSIDFSGMDEAQGLKKLDELIAKIGTDKVLYDERACATKRKGVWKELGKNKYGEMVYEDQNGVRFRTSGSVRINQTVELSPGGTYSLVMSPDFEVEGDRKPDTQKMIAFKNNMAEVVGPYAGFKPGDILHLDQDVYQDTGYKDLIDVFYTENGMAHNSRIPKRLLNFDLNNLVFAKNILKLEKPQPEPNLFDPNKQQSHTKFKPDDTVRIIHLDDVSLGNGKRGESPYNGKIGTVVNSQPNDIDVAIPGLTGQFGVGFLPNNLEKIASPKFKKGDTAYYKGKKVELLSDGKYDTLHRGYSYLAIAEGWDDSDNVGEYSLSKDAPKQASIPTHKFEPGDVVKNTTNKLVGTIKKRITSDDPNVMQSYSVDINRGGHAYWYEDELEPVSKAQPQPDQKAAMQTAIAGLRAASKFSDTATKTKLAAAIAGLEAALKFM